MVHILTIIQIQPLLFNFNYKLVLYLMKFVIIKQIILKTCIKDRYLQFIYLFMLLHSVEE
jgi:hypothetical protein